MKYFVFMLVNKCGQKFVCKACSVYITAWSRCIVSQALLQVYIKNAIKINKYISVCQHFCILKICLLFNVFKSNGIYCGHLVALPWSLTHVYHAPWLADCGPVKLTWNGQLGGWEGKRQGIHDFPSLSQFEMYLVSGVGDLNTIETVVTWLWAPPMLHGQSSLHL